jgi:hypothetical protein
MRWLLLPLLLLLAGATAKDRCPVLEFYRISWIGNPTQRHTELSQWLTANGDFCSADKLTSIWNNLAMWAGTADSQELRGKVIFFYEKAIEKGK